MSSNQPSDAGAQPQGAASSNQQTHANASTRGATSSNTPVNPKITPKPKIDWAKRLGHVIPRYHASIAREAASLASTKELLKRKASLEYEYDGKKPKRHGLTPAFAKVLAQDSKPQSTNSMGFSTSGTTREPTMAETVSKRQRGFKHVMGPFEKVETADSSPTEESKTSPSNTPVNNSHSFVLSYLAHLARSDIESTLEYNEIDFSKSTMAIRGFKALLHDEPTFRLIARKVAKCLEIFGKNQIQDIPYEDLYKIEVAKQEIVQHLGLFGNYTPVSVADEDLEARRQRSECWIRMKGFKNSLKSLYDGFERYLHIQIRQFSTELDVKIVSWEIEQPPQSTLDIFTSLRAFSRGLAQHTTSVIIIHRDMVQAHIGNCSRTITSAPNVMYRCDQLEECLQNTTLDCYTLLATKVREFKRIYMPLFAYFCKSTQLDNIRKSAELFQDHMKPIHLMLLKVFKISRHQTDLAQLPTTDEILASLEAPYDPEFVETYLSSDEEEIEGNT